MCSQCCLTAGPSRPPAGLGAVQLKLEPRPLVLGAFDYLDLPLIAAVRARLRAQAPRIDLRARQMRRSEISAALTERHVDVALGPLTSDFGSFQAIPLFIDRFVVLARYRHPHIRRSRTIDKFAKLPQLIVAPGDGVFEMIDQALLRFGLSRAIAFTARDLRAAASQIRMSDLVMVMPARCAQMSRSAGRFEVHELPVHVPPWTVGLLYRKGHPDYECIKWLGSLISEIAAWSLAGRIP